ncbi:hypothetical protein [Streptomyces sp. NPDC020362]|uniref:hypothetical protein n=1 Tax=unclassified Streptomyces TaxID=2593676 RepID=UPI000A7A22EF
MSSRTLAVIAIALVVALIFGIGAYAWTGNPSDAMTMFGVGLFGTAMLGMTIKDEVPKTAPRRLPTDSPDQPGGGDA